MIFPRVLADMEEARYHFEGSSVCDVCHKPIEVWVQHSIGQRLKYDAMPTAESLVVPHCCHSHRDPSSRS